MKSPREIATEYGAMHRSSTTDVEHIIEAAIMAALTQDEKLDDPTLFLPVDFVRQQNAEYEALISDLKRSCREWEGRMSAVMSALNADLHPGVDAETLVRRLQCEVIDATFAANGWKQMAEKPTIERCVTTLSKALQEDPGFAISWQSNIAMPILDACKNLGAPMDHATANHLADGLMLHLFGVKQAAMPEKVKASRGAEEA